MNKIDRLKTPLFLVVLILVTFHRAYFSEFVSWDDNVLVTGNSLMTMDFWSAIKSTFSGFIHGDYIPLAQMSFWLDLNLFEFSASGMHLENLLLHSLNVILVYSILISLNSSSLLAILVSIVFAIHPMQVESVMWISERKGLMASFFFLLASRIFLSARPWSGMIGGAYLLSLLSKMNGIFFPLFAILQVGGSKKISKPLQFSMGFMMLFFIFIRVQSYRLGTTGFEEAILSLERLWQVPLMVLAAIGFYAGQFFWPSDLKIIYPAFELNLDFVMLIGLGLFVILVDLKPLRNPKEPLQAWGSWLAVLTLLPILPFVPRLSFVNDRHFYLPLIGFSILAIWPFTALLERVGNKKTEILITSLLVLVLSVMSYRRSLVWENSMTLWQQTEKDCPDCFIATNNLALEYQRRGQYHQALEKYLSLLSSSADLSVKALGYNNLATLYGDSRYAGASLLKSIQTLEEGLKLNLPKRDSYEIRLNLGNYEIQSGNKARATEVLKALIQDLRREPDLRFQKLISMAEELLRQ